LLKVEDPYGRAYSYLYNDHRQLKTVVDFAGREISFERLTKPFDVLAAVLLPEVTSESLAPGAEGQTRGRITFGYDGAKRLERASTHKGVLFVNRYQTADCGRIESQEIGEPAYTVQIKVTSRHDAGAVARATVTRAERMVQTYEFYASEEAGQGPMPANGSVVPSVVTLVGTDSPPESTELYYNRELEVARVIRPRRNQTVLQYDIDNADRLAHGNLRVQTQYPLIGSLVTTEWRSLVLAGHEYLGPVHEKLASALERSDRKTNGPLVTRWVYHARFNKVTQVTRPDLTVIDYEYDATHGNLERIRLPVGPTRSPTDPLASTRAERTMVHNAAGQLVLVTDEEGRSIRLSYFTPRGAGPTRQVGGDAGVTDVTAERGDRGGYLGRIEDLARHTTAYQSRDERGNVTKTVDPRGVVSTWKHDARDAVLTYKPGVTLEDLPGTKSGTVRPTSGIPVFQYRYDADGNRTFMRTQHGSASNAPGVDETSVYDSLRRLVDSTRQLDVGVTANVVHQYGTDGLLELTTDPALRKVRSTYDEKLRLTRQVQEGSKPIETEYEYDVNGNRIREQVGTGTKATWTFYDSYDRAIATLDPAGALTVHVLDAMGRSVATEVYGESQYLDEKATGSLAVRFKHDYGLLSAVSRTYYPRGWLATESVDPRCYVGPESSAARESRSIKIVHTTSYNRVGEVVETGSEPFGATLRRVYNPATARLARLEKIDDASPGSLPAVTTHFEHDAVGEVIEQREELHGIATYTTKRGFDRLGRLVDEDPPGDYTPSAISYDYRGNRVRTTGPMGTEVVGYDLGNRETSRTVNGRVMMRQSWLKNGQLETQTDARLNVTRYEYTDTGRVDHVTFADHRTQEFLYETGTGKLVEQTLRGGTRIGITMDDAGRVTARTVEHLSGVSDGDTPEIVMAGGQSFRFDALGRLTQATEEASRYGARSTVYKTYDGLGRGCHEGLSLALTPGSALYEGVFPTTKGRDAADRFERLVSTRHFDGESAKRVADAPASAHSEVSFPSLGVKQYHALTRAGLASGWVAQRETGDELMSGTLALRTDGLPLHYATRAATGTLGARGQYAVTGAVRYNDARQISNFTLTQHEVLKDGSEQSMPTVETFEYVALKGLLHSKLVGPKPGASSTGDYSTSYSEYQYQGDAYPHGLIGRTGSEISGPYKLIAGRELTTQRIPSQRVAQVVRQFTEVAYRGDGELAERGVKQEVEQVDLTTTQKARYEVPDTGINELNQLVEATQKLPYSGTDSFTYRAPGNMVRYALVDADGTRELSLSWDPYNRLQKVVGTFRRKELVNESPSDPPIVQFVTRVVTCHFAYTALNQRVLKVSTTVRSTVSSTIGGVTFTQRIQLAKWAHHARGTVAEDAVIREVSDKNLSTGAYKSQGATVHHHVYLDSNGQHQAILRFKLAAVQGEFDGDGTLTPDKLFALMRDGSHTIRGIVDAETGRRVEDLFEGFSGNVIRLQGDANPDNEPKVTLSYDYLAGGEVDTETQLNLIGMRYMWPEQQRWISVDSMGLFFDPNAYGDSYLYAGGNPLVGRTFGLSHRKGQGATPIDLVAYLERTLDFVMSAEGILAMAEVVGGALEASVGAGLIKTGVLSPIGVLMVADGMDHVITGLKTIAYAEFQQTYLSQGIQSVTGISREEADSRAAGISLAIGLAGGFASGLRGGMAASSAGARTAEDVAIVAGVSFLTEEGGNCFLAGTRVSMADGSKKRIEDVKDGEWVKAMNPATGGVESREVTRLFRNWTTSVVDVTWVPMEATGRQRGRGERHASGGCRGGDEGGEDGEPPLAGEQTVRCTPGHPWWVESRGAWVFAGELAVGDVVRLEDGRHGVVQRVKVREEVAQTFNFEVEGLHCYFVGSDVDQPGVLVHNMSWRTAYRGTAVGRLPKLSGKEPPAVRRLLGSRGFSLKDATEKGEVWVHADRSIVRIDKPANPARAKYPSDSQWHFHKEYIDESNVRFRLTDRGRVSVDPDSIHIIGRGKRRR